MSEAWFSRTLSGLIPNSLQRVGNRALPRAQNPFQYTFLVHERVSPFPTYPAANTPRPSPRPDDTTIYVWMYQYEYGKLI